MGLFAVYSYYSPELPAIEVLRDVRFQVPLRVYSRDRELIAEFGEKRRKPARYDEIPQTMVQAFLAAEDDRFFEHPGVDYQGILRAVTQLLLTGEKKQGGSTITMQMARNFFLTRDKTYERKIKEILLALKIERSLTKAEILELYLNKIYLGNRAYGVGAAAEVYYGRSLQALDLAQIAMIAGLPKAPSKYNPIANAERAILRRDYVLGRMLDLGYIDSDAYRDAKSAGVTAYLHSTPVDVEAPHIAEMVRAQMVASFGEGAYTNGYSVITSLDANSQDFARQALRKALDDYDQRHGYRGAEAVLAPEQMASVEAMDKVLSGYSRVGDLLPGIVVSVEEKSARIYMGRGLTVQLAWSGIKWARTYIDENKREAVPKIVADVLSVGDVIRLREESVVADGKPKHEQQIWVLRQKPAVSGALVALNPRDGAILGLVGSYDFYDNKFNRALQSRRQPGSGFKPVMYAAALEAGFTPASTILDAPIVFEDKSMQGGAWRPKNYSGEFFGPTRLRQALYKSRNLVSVRLLDAVGIKPVRAMARRFGFAADEVPNNMTISLGSGASAPLRMASAYAIFANGGFRIKPYLIDSVLDHKGEEVLKVAPYVACRHCPDGSGEMMLEPATDDELFMPLRDYMETAENDEQSLPQPIRLAPRVLSPQVHFQIASILQDVVKRGTARKALKLNRTDLGGKTGTTNEQRDAWFNGFNPDIVATAWVGFDDLNPLGKRETGGQAALPMWIDFMGQALQGKRNQAFLQPDGMVTIKIDPATGYALAPGQPGGIFETFRKELAPGTGTGSGQVPGSGETAVGGGSATQSDIAEELF